MVMLEFHDTLPLKGLKTPSIDLAANLGVSKNMNFRFQHDRCNLVLGKGSKK